MAKKSSIFVLSIVLLINLLLLTQPAMAADKMPYVDVPVTYTGPPILDRFAIYLGPNHHMYKEGWAELTKTIGKRTEGKVNVKEFLGGVLFKARDGFKAVRSNICDMTPAYPNYSPTGFNLVLGAGLPFMFENAMVAARVLEELYPKYFKKSYEALGSKLLLMSSCSNYHLFTNKPITKLEQLKGLKVRSGGGFFNKLAKGLGMIPVVVSSPEIYTAVQRGIVDGVLYSWASAESYKLYEVCKYVTEIGPGIATFAPTSGIVNPAWIKKLPPDLKKLVYGSAREAAILISASYEDHTPGARKTFKEHGVQIIQLAPEELKRWKAATRPVVDEWVNQMEAKGLPAKQMIKEMRALNAKYKDLTKAEMLELQRTNPVPMDEIW
jgi:TRAP-type transport system periplasmic protein